MRNATVKEVIERLQKMNQDAIVCRRLDDEATYSSIETMAEVKNAIYINDAGDDAVGDIVSIY